MTVVIHTGDALAYCSISNEEELKTHIRSKRGRSMSNWRS